MLSNRRWLRREHPFPHIVANDVFTPDVSEALSDQVRAIFDQQKRVSHFGYYDAFNWTFQKNQEWPLKLFISPEWVRLIGKAMGVPVNGYVSGGLHHHKVGSAPGWVHTDFSRVYFTEPDKGLPNITLPRNDAIGHMNGEIIKKGTQSHVTVRGISILYYTANEQWHEGDGGETGLYLHQSDPVDRPAARVPPRNNAMVVFECTPASFHSYLTNRRIERNSVVMWLHRDEDQAIGRWGDASFSPPPAGIKSKAQ